MAKRPSPKSSSAPVDFREKLWLAADELRGSIDAAEYKHVVLGLIFLKYISDAFNKQRAELDRKSRDKSDSDGFYCDTDADRNKLLEDEDEYAAANVFFVPEGSRWEAIKASVGQADLSKRIDDAMIGIEDRNGKLKGILPRNYAGRGIPVERMSNLIKLVSDVDLVKDDGKGKGDTLGSVYQYFLGKFAAAEGKLGGEFYTPQSIVRLLVEMIEPFDTTGKGARVYDPCCGSGGMFVQSEEFVAHYAGLKHVDAAKARRNISIFGQESNLTTWKLAKMNLAIRGIQANLGPRHADTFTDNLHPDLRADFILANPPFNISSWHGDILKKDVRWAFGTPPEGNANYAWIQHFVHHLAPANGRGGGIAGFVMANGSLSSNSGGEGEIREKLIRANLVDCIVALPAQLFMTTGIAVCLWFLRKGKDKRNDPTDGKTLFINARELGVMETRTLRILTDEELARIANTYHAWRQTESSKLAKLPAYEDRKGFCYSASLADMEKHGFVLTPGWYVGAEDVVDDGEPFAEKIERLFGELERQFAESKELSNAILADTRRFEHVNKALLRKASDE